METKMLKAVFDASDAPAVKEAIRQEEKAWGDSDWDIRTDEKHGIGFAVFGPAQQVMFVIGRLAAFGHDSLEGVQFSRRAA